MADDFDRLPHLREPVVEGAKQRVLKTRSGARVRSPRPMTDDEWFDFKMTDAFDKLRDQAERRRESERLTGLPSYLLLDSVFGGIGKGPESRHPTGGYDEADRDITLARVRADERRKAGGAASNITTCQARNSDGKPIAASIGDRLRGYRRVLKFPDTKGGKRNAQQASDEIRASGEGDLHTRVLRVYCHDTEVAGYYWTVWVNRAASDERGFVVREGMRRGYGKGTEIATYHEGRAWMADRTAAKNAVECPKCGAPAGQQCTTQDYPDGSKTNAHKPRVFAYYDAEGQEPASGSKRERLGGGHGGY